MKILKIMLPIFFFSLFAFDCYLIYGYSDKIKYKNVYVGFLLLLSILLFILLYNKIAKVRMIDITFPSLNYIIIAICLTPIAILLLNTLCFLIFANTQNGFVPAITEMNEKTQIAELFFSILLVPICEEFVFRGIMLSIYHSKMGILYAIIISSILFGFSHGVTIEFKVYATIIAFILSICFIIAQNISYPIILHISYNLIIAIFDYVSEIRPDMFQQDINTKLIRANSTAWISCVFLALISIVPIYKRIMKLKR